MRESKIEVRDADPAYVEEKVGAALYVHLRTVPANGTLRRGAIERAWEMYDGRLETPSRGAADSACWFCSGRCSPSRTSAGSSTPTIDAVARCWPQRSSRRLGLFDSGRPVTH